MRTTHVAHLTTVLLWALYTTPMYAQSADEKALWDFVVGETNAYFTSDTDALLKMWVQDNRATRTFVASGGYTKLAGWKEVEPWIVESTQSPASGVKPKVEPSNLAILSDGHLASIQYDAKITDPSGLAYETQEYRTLVKEGGRWKFVSMSTIFTDSYAEGAAAVENAINMAGYNMLSGGKVDEAIEIFQLNVKLFPGSWNVYDSLGEAYMAAGKNELAIQYYSKSIELNPENSNGKAMLAKLNQK